MRVTLALLADAANVSREGKLNILGVFDTIYARQFPTAHPQMQLVMRFETGVEDTGRAWSVSIALLAPDGQVVFRVPGSVTAPTSVVGERVQIDRIVALAGVTFAAPGRYALAVAIDGATAATVPLRVELLGTAH